MPSVSAIIPNYNYANFLEQRINSVLEQSEHIDEIIILDDASTDCSAEILKTYNRFPKIKIVKNKINSGNAFKQWTKGARMAKGDLLWIAEADDFAAPNFLKRLLSCFRGNQNIAFAYCASQAVNEYAEIIEANYANHQYLKDISSFKWKKDYVCNGIDEIRHALCIKNTILNVSSVIFERRKLLNLLNEKYDEISLFHMAGDWYIYIELLRNYQLAYCSDVLNFHRRHKKSITIHSYKTALQQLSEVRRMHEHILRSFSLPEECLYRMFDYELEFLAANPEMPKTAFANIADWEKLHALWVSTSGPAAPDNVFTPRTMAWTGMTSEDDPSGGLLTQGMLASWDIQFPPKMPHSLNTVQDAETFYIGWNVFWNKMFPYIACGTPSHIPETFLREEDSGASFSIPRWAWLFYSSRDDLQKIFSLKNERDCAIYLYWLLEEIEKNKYITLNIFVKSLADWLAVRSPQVFALPRFVFARLNPFLKDLKKQNNSSPFATEKEELEFMYVWWHLRARWDDNRYQDQVVTEIPDSLRRCSSQGNAFPLPLWAYRFWQGIHTLHTKFSLHTEKEVVIYLVWLCNDLLAQKNFTELFVFFDDLVEWLKAPCAHMPALPRICLSFSTETAHDTTEIASLLCRSLEKCGTLFLGHFISCFTIESIRKLLNSDPLSNDGIPLFFKGLSHYATEIHEKCPSLTTSKEQKTILNWYREKQKNNPNKHYLLDYILNILDQRLSEERFNGVHDIHKLDNNILIANDNIPLFRGMRLFHGTLEEGGVNIIGFARGVLGIGEDVRMAVRAFRYGQIPFSVFSPKLDIPSQQNDDSIEQCIADSPVYRTNILFIPARETLLLYMRMGPSIFNFRHTICSWQWELPHFPFELRKATILGQSFWASSTFTANAIRESTNLPVTYVPMVVELPHFVPLGKQAHGLPEDCFIFLNIFDSLSWGARKNPLATIKAFKDAFPSDSSIRLVIKTMNATPDSPFWKAIMQESLLDNRILCINEAYTKEQLLSLYSCCDAYISLHRAEGFGRTIAEAMLMGKPVIATAWSGNADFTNEKTAFPIYGKLVPVREGEYLFHENQYWCNPDHDQAVFAMRQCVQNCIIAKQKARCGQRYIQKNYSAEAVGNIYRRLLI